MSPRTKKCQDESMRRLSRPNRRWSTSPTDLLREVRPSFWRYATAKSVEDLIRALRKRRRAKRSFRVDDYFILEKQKKIIEERNKQNLANEEGIPGLQINFFGKKYLYPFRTPFLTKKWAKSSAPVSVFDDYLEDFLLIFENDDADDKSELICATPAPVPDGVEPTAVATCHGLRDCIQSADEVFKDIENAIREEEEKIRAPRTGHPVLPSREPRKGKKIRPKDQRRVFKFIQRMTEMEEVNNIVCPSKGQDKTDIVLHEKYLPGHETAAEDKVFIKQLQTKLERLQGDLPAAHWTKKKQEMSATRLSLRRRP